MPETISGTQEASSMAEIVVTVDHVYLPLDAEGNVRTDWAVTNVSTTKVSKRARLRAPADLAGRKSRSSTPPVCSSNSASSPTVTTKPPGISSPQYTSPLLSLGSIKDTFSTYAGRR